MSRQQNRFDAVNVSSACSTSWDTMSGTSQKKFCGECNKHVFDFSQMSRREADAIIEASRGNLCARITRTAEGKILTKEPIPILPVRIQNRRTSPAANLLMSAVLGITPAMITVVPLAVSAATYSQNSSDQNPKTEGGNASISGTVVDTVEAIITDANISLSSDSIVRQTTTSNADGAYSFQNIASGVYAITVTRSGYAPTFVKEIQVGDNQQKIQDIQLREGRLETATLGMSFAPPATLRVRYVQSPLIIDATVGKSSVAEVEKDFKVIRTELQINSFLKGFQATNTVTYYHNVFAEDEATLKEGDTVLAFLEPREKGQEGFRASQYEKGIQVLTSSEMQIYAARIRELRELTYRRNASPDEIAEWLVRCAQEPATRWEGVQELKSGFRNLEYRMERIEQCKKEGKSAFPLDAPETIPSSPRQFEGRIRTDPDPEGKFAEALTIAQKNTLSEILFSTRDFSADDLTLLSLVMKWEKEKTLPFAIHQLKQKWSEDFAPTSALLEMLSEEFGDEAYGDDEEFDELVTEFGNITFHEKEELDDEKLSVAEKTELLKANEVSTGQQKNTLQKIIDAAETKLRTSKK